MQRPGGDEDLIAAVIVARRRAFHKWAPAAASGPGAIEDGITRCRAGPRSPIEGVYSTPRFPTGGRSDFGRGEDGFQKREDLRASWGVFTFLGGMRGRESEEPDSQACP